jgi:hypothetical protein
MCKGVLKFTHDRQEDDGERSARPGYKVGIPLKRAVKRQLNIAAVIPITAAWAMKSFPSAAKAVILYPMDMGRVVVAADMAPTQSPFVVFTGITFFNRFRLDKMSERCLQTLNCFTIRGWGWSIVHLKKMILLKPFNG